MPYTCLLLNDVNLTSPPLSADCTDTTTSSTFMSHFTNAPFSIEALHPEDGEDLSAARRLLVGRLQGRHR